LPHGPRVGGPDRVHQRIEESAERFVAPVHGSQAALDGLVRHGQLAQHLVHPLLGDLVTYLHVQVRLREILQGRLDAAAPEAVDYPGEEHLPGRLENEQQGNALGVVNGQERLGQQAVGNLPAHPVRLSEKGGQVRHHAGHLAQVAEIPDVMAGVLVQVVTGHPGQRAVTDAAGIDAQGILEAHHPEGDRRDDRQQVLDGTVRGQQPEEGMTRQSCLTLVDVVQDLLHDAPVLSVLAALAAPAVTDSSGQIITSGDVMG
jgi:hypothetical protein